MLVGVMSDSHDNLEKVRKAVEIFKERRIEVLLHAGDFCSPFVFMELKKLQSICREAFGVFGNNDGDKLLLAQNSSGFCKLQNGIMKLELDGKRIAMMHYPDVARELHDSGIFDLVIYGHVHKKLVEGDRKKLLNPGACSGYIADEATVALVELRDMSVEFVKL